MLVDIHSHILPETDDGARSMGEALAMARMAVAEGITDLIATPHTYRGVYDNKASSIVPAVHRLQKELDRQQIPLRVHPGCEVYLHRELVTHVQNGTLITLGDTGQYMLLELPSGHLPGYVDEVLQGLLAIGITPVVAHPERQSVLRTEPERLARWVEQGVLTQVTAASLLGTMGKQSKRTAEMMVKHHLVHCLASDAHRQDRRQPLVRKAYAELAALTSEEVVQNFKANAQAILQGEPCVRLDVPRKMRRAAFAFRF